MNSSPNQIRSRYTEVIIGAVTGPITAPETIIAGQGRAVVVAEVAADTGRQGGVWRHPLQSQRYRSDLTPTDLPPFRN